MYNTLEKSATFFLVAFLVTGCTGTGPDSSEPMQLAGPPPASIEHDPKEADGGAGIVATPRTAEEQLDELRRLTQGEPPSLTLGKGDVLSVSVYDEPDLTIDSVPVRPDGKIALPLVGELDVEGRSVEEVTRELTTSMALYVQDPKVAVLIREFNSLEYTLYGEVVRPGAYSLVTDVTITEAIAKAGGLTRGQFRASSVELADLTHAFIARDKRVLPVDFVRLIRSGDLRFDIPLRAGDYIYIPSGLSKEIYILGEVRQPSAFSYREEMPVSRTMALAEGFTPDADISRVHIIRGSLHNPTVIVTNYEEVLTGQVQDVQLEPGDVVYVPPTTLTSWARVIDKILPTIQTLQVGIILGNSVSD
jgi:polysaccharide export outer membrane protein